MNFRLINLIPTDWSRAEEDEEEDDNDIINNNNQPSASIDFVFSLTKPSNNDKLTSPLVFIGAYAAGSSFLKAIRTATSDQSSPVAVITQKSVSGTKTEEIQMGSLYRFNEKALFVELNKSIEQKHANMFTSILCNHVTALERVILIDSIKVFQYKAEEIPNPPHVTCMQTKSDKLKRNADVNYLPSPNIISGVTAAVLSHCQMFNIDAICYITLEENHTLEPISLIALGKYLLPLLGIHYQNKRRGQFDYVKAMPRLRDTSLYL
jgi:hypothetical protein